VRCTSSNRAAHSSSGMGWCGKTITVVRVPPVVCATGASCPRALCKLNANPA